MSLPEQPEKIGDTITHRVQVHLPSEYKQWFLVIANVEHRKESQQGRMVLMDFVDRWKREHPELVAKYEAAIKAAVAEQEVAA